MRIFMRDKEKENESMIKLKKNERLVYAGNIPLRAPSGKPLPSVPQYVIVSIDEADPAYVREVQKNERIILAGHVLHDKKKAEERFAALQAGREIKQIEERTPLYILTGVENIDPKSGLPYETAKALAAAGKDLAALISIQKRKERALAKQGKSRGNENDENQN